MGCRSAYTRRALGVFAGIRTMCFRSPRAAQARPQPQARPATPSNGARVQVKPRAGGRLPIKLKSRHRGVVVRDLKGRERAVRGDAEPPLGLKKCSRARQGGRGERHCLLITGYRGVDGTFVNGHRRLYRTHPGPAGWRSIIRPSSLCTPEQSRHPFPTLARNPHLLWLSQPSLRGSTPWRLRVDHRHSAASSTRAPT